MKYMQKSLKRALIAAFHFVFAFIFYKHYTLVEEGAVELNFLIGIRDKVAMVTMR